MTAIDVLRDEHRRIEQMLTVLDRVASGLEHGGVAPAYVEELLDFFRLFADARHHRKEEDRLFPVIAGHGFSQDFGVVEALKHQHELGRTHVRDMRVHLAALRAGDYRAGEAFVASAHAYAELLRVHIRMEDDDLYPDVASTLTREEERALADLFTALDTTKTALDESTRWDRLAEQAAGFSR
jgi:hemerythrin-like domain-containing protein